MQYGVQLYEIKLILNNIIILINGWLTFDFLRECVNEGSIKMICLAYNDYKRLVIMRIELIAQLLSSPFKTKFSLFL